MKMLGYDDGAIEGRPDENKHFCGGQRVAVATASSKQTDSPVVRSGICGAGFGRGPCYSAASERCSLRNGNAVPQLGDREVNHGNNKALAVQRIEAGQAGTGNGTLTRWAACHSSPSLKEERGIVSIAGRLRLPRPVY